MDHTLVVKQQRCQRLFHDEANTVLPVGIKDTRFTAFDAVAANQQDNDKINTIAVRPLWRRASDAAGGVDAKLVRLDEPLFHWLHLCK